MIFEFFIDFSPYRRKHKDWLIHYIVIFLRRCPGYWFYLQLWFLLARAELFQKLNIWRLIRLSHVPRIEWYWYLSHSHELTYLIMENMASAWQRIIRIMDNLFSGVLIVRTLQCVAEKLDISGNENKIGNENKTFALTSLKWIWEQFGIHSTLLFYVTIASADDHMNAGAIWVARPGHHVLVYSAQLLQDGSLHRIDCFVHVLVGLGLHHALEEIVKGITVRWEAPPHFQLPVGANFFMQPCLGFLASRKGAVLPEDVGASIGVSVQRLLHNVSQKFFVELGSDLQPLWGEKQWQACLSFEMTPRLMSEEGNFVRSAMVTSSMSLQIHLSGCLLLNWS